MNLYNVSLKLWNEAFSGFLNTKMLSVGENREDAINRVKHIIFKDAEGFEFEAEKIDKVMGYDIIVK